MADDVHNRRGAALGQLILLGVAWRDHLPYLRARSSIEAPSTLVPVAGKRLSYRTSDSAKRTCIGHVPFRKRQADQIRDYQDCDNQPQPGSRVCKRCAIVEATFASNLHHSHTRGSAELDPAIREHLDQPNRLYLAGFRDGTLKIGTSTRSRAQRRLEEQGAWHARFVAETTDGRIVRRLEDAVTEQIGIPQSVSATRKLAGLINPIDDRRLAAAIAEAAQHVVAAVLEPMADPSITALDEVWRHPMAEHPAVNRAIEYPLRIDRGRHDLEFITALGRHVLARRPGANDVFALDPAPLYGRWLELGDYGSDEIAIQDSLF